MMQLLWALDHSLQVLSKRMMKELRITGPQRLVLKIVRENPRISAGGLAQYLHIDPSTLTGILQRLERRRLLRRLVDPDDGRRAQFEVTAKGAEHAAVRTGTVEQAVLRTLQGLTPDTIQGARTFLAAMIAEMEREGRGRDASPALERR